MNVWRLFLVTPLVATTLTLPAIAQHPTKSDAPNTVQTDSKGLHALGDLPIIDVDGARKAAKSLSLSQDGDKIVKQLSWTQADALYQQAMELWPHNYSALYGRAKCAVAGGDIATAISYYRSAIYSDSPDAKIFRENDVTRMMEFALLLSQTGQTNEAIEVYRHATGLLNYRDGKQNVKVLLPDFGAGQATYTPMRLQAMAHVAIAIESQDESIKADHVTKAVGLYPDSGIAYYYLGEVLTRINTVQAKAAYDRAVQLGDASIDRAVKEALNIIQ